MTGNAQLVAQEIELRLEDSGTKINIIDMDKLEPDVFQNDGDYLICTSTYGQGDVPDNARDFFNALKDQKPNLAHTRYGVIALGDRTYAETYCHGGKNSMSFSPSSAPEGLARYFFMTQVRVRSQRKRVANGPNLGLPT
jgi:flavodoxin